MDYCDTHTKIKLLIWKCSSVGMGGGVIKIQRGGRTMFCPPLSNCCRKGFKMCKIMHMYTHHLLFVNKLLKCPFLTKTDRK